MNSKQIKRKLLYIFAPRIIWLVLIIIFALTKKRFHITQNLPQGSYIVVFWHGELAMMPFIYKAVKKATIKQNLTFKDYYIISSDHFDGLLVSKVCGYFGLKFIRGSSSKNALKALIESMRILRSGDNVGITPDGPKGPYHSISNGTIAIAQKTQKPIVVLSVKCENAWQLPFWDKTAIPKPFSTIHFYANEGFIIPKDMPLDKAKKLLAQKMPQD